MERTYLNITLLIASALNGASAVCSSVLASWLAAGSSLVNLGFLLNSFLFSASLLPERNSHNKALNTFPSVIGTQTRRAFGIIAPHLCPLA